MKVCDQHHDRAAVDAIVVANDDTRVDVCAECKAAVLAIFSQPHEPVEAPRRRGLLDKIKDSVRAD